MGPKLASIFFLSLSVRLYVDKRIGGGGRDDEEESVAYKTVPRNGNPPSIDLRANTKLNDILTSTVYRMRYD